MVCLGTSVKVQIFAVFECFYSCFSCYSFRHKLLSYNDDVFANTALIYVLSRDILDLFIKLRVKKILKKM